MAVTLPSNIEYLGSKPNFTRDSFKTKAEMEAALRAGYIDEGHPSYCFEDGVTWKAVMGQATTVAGTGSGSPLRVHRESGTVMEPLSTDSYKIYNGISMRKGDTITLSVPDASIDCYLYDIPELRVGTQGTLLGQAVWASGSYTYTAEVDINLVVACDTYPETLGYTHHKVPGLIWIDEIGALKALIEELTQRIQNLEGEDNDE